ncbi:FG-GAP repeat protein [Planctomycetes bacterium Poly30]|uniref:FG-GAP repeat protein n=1 Tax=Saltatorellus ferox TaxID=2528018 RepID=A0A518ENS8_9BACT|nr:FG-GAP repeat protein [Planctomycetes bacterium Poly30]
MLACFLGALCLSASSQSFGLAEILTTRQPLREDAIPTDLDLDGDLDLLTIGGGAGQLGWIENMGSGQFGVLRAIDCRLPGGASNPTSAACEDFDGDGVLDLVVSARALSGLGSPLIMYQGLGGGQFGPPSSLALPSNSSSVLSADLDGDGHVDLAFIDLAAGVSWLRNDGAGGFALPIPLAAPDGIAKALRLGDLDGDGRADLYWSQAVVRRVQWVRNLGGGGFGPAQSFGGDISLVESLADGDFDLDGDLDLVVGALGGLYLIENVGGGQFLDRVLIPSAQSRVIGVQVADLDGDGAADLVAADGTADSFAFYRNIGSGQFAPAVSLVGTTAGAATVRIADLDGDGDGDPIHIADDITWFENRGGGQFGPLLPVTRSVPGRPFDFDGDGDLDLVGVEGGSVVVSGNLGEGVFGRPIPLVSGLQGAMDAVLVDVGSDGDQDVVVASSPHSTLFQVLWFERTSAGLEAPRVLYESGPAATSRLEVLNLDGDADNDVVLFHSGPLSTDPATVLWLRNETAAGTSGSLEAQAPMAVPGLSSLVWKDVDADGVPDLVARSVGLPLVAPRILHFPGGANGTLGAPIVLASLGPESGPQIDLGDLDGDGDLDVVFHRGTGGQSVTWCENLGAGIFATRAFIRSIPAFGNEILAFDVDLDGDDDIFCWGPKGVWGEPSGRWIESLGGGAFGPVREVAHANWLTLTRSATAVDLDGDSDLDLIREFDGLRCLQFNERFLGTLYCGPAVPNSTGLPAEIRASGSAAIQVNDAVLHASHLPAGSFGYFLVADRSSAIVMPGGSQGTLCLGGSVGRLNRGPAEIFQANGGGRASVVLDLMDLPSPTGSSTVEPGETRYFQAWYRDAQPTATSNFTNALRVRFRW